MRYTFCSFTFQCFSIEFETNVKWPKIWRKKNRHEEKPLASCVTLDRRKTKIESKREMWRRAEAVTLSFWECLPHQSFLQKDKNEEEKMNEFNALKHGRQRGREREPYYEMKRSENVWIVYQKIAIGLFWGEMVSVRHQCYVRMRCMKTSLCVSIWCVGAIGSEHYRVNRVTVCAKIIIIITIARSVLVFIREFQVSPSHSIRYRNCIMFCHTFRFSRRKIEFKNSSSAIELLH